LGTSLIMPKISQTGDDSMIANGQTLDPASLGKTVKIRPGPPTVRDLFRPMHSCEIEATIKTLHPRRQ